MTSPCTFTLRKYRCSLILRQPLTRTSGPDPKEVQRARELCEDLLANVKEQYERFKENPPQRGYGGYGHDNRQQSYSTQNPYGTYGGAQSPATPSTAATPGPPGASSPTDYTAQYAQYYASQPGGDPYAAWGGYANYVAYYQYYQQAQQQQQQSAPGAAPPAPPGDEPPPPPPPPSGSPPATGGYNNVGLLSIRPISIAAELKLGSTTSRYVGSPELVNHVGKKQPLSTGMEDGEEGIDSWVWRTVVNLSAPVSDTCNISGSGFSFPHARF